MLDVFNKISEAHSHILKEAFVAPLAKSVASMGAKGLGVVKRNPMKSLGAGLMGLEVGMAGKSGSQIGNVARIRQPNIFSGTF